MKWSLLEQIYKGSCGRADAFRVGHVLSSGLGVLTQCLRFLVNAPVSGRRRRMVVDENELKTDKINIVS